jgi:hypothetical protein
MAVLRAIMACSTLVVAACYGPELRDCAVSCASGADCAPGQVCGTDRWCAAPEVAGRCGLPDGGTSLTGDASIGGDGAVPGDAATPVAAAPPDAPGPVILVIQIMGHGSVAIANVGSCNDHAPGHQCTFAVSGGVQRQLVATGAEGDEFDKWTSVACAGQDETCSLTPVLPSTTVSAKFKH